MATLVFSAVGTLVGGPLGGALGALLGRQVDGIVLGGGNRKGPRLKELDVTTSSYGAAIPRLFGRMRVPGTVIWSTDLREHSDSQGGGKGGPSVTTYSYTVSFAVALSSRPIRSIGRIWADGRLLRGEGGDLKAGGELRIHTGLGDQPADPVMVEVEGADHCPAHRGLAYVVFEDLDLSEFYNRLPSLTFEVIADEAAAGGAFGLQDVVGEVIADVDAAVPLDEIAGLSCEGPLAEVLAALDPVMPIGVDAGGTGLTIARERRQAVPIALAEPAVAAGDDAFGGASGMSRSRSAPADQPFEAMRYYDLERDYLPGVQRSPGRPRAGQPATLDLPVALTAANARKLAQRLRQRADWTRDRLAWRTTTLDPALGPGSIVSLPDRPGRWRVREWEWRDKGVELGLERVVPTGADEVPAGGTDPGRHNPPDDLAPAPTTLVAFELPWNGAGQPSCFAAVSSTGAHWSGAALYADHGDGELVPLGPSGRVRSAIGRAVTVLGSGTPLLLDTSASVDVELLSPDMELAQAHARGLAMGANLALLGGELIQFARAAPIGPARWRLTCLLRGRGGTEMAIAGHAPGEAFVLLDGRATALDTAKVGDTSVASIVAVGRGDPDPVVSAVALPGIALRPPSPVHPRRIETVNGAVDGALNLSWTRRSRDGWAWRDGVDAPLGEQGELYRVTYGPTEAPLAEWTVAASEISLPAAQVAALAAALPGGSLLVRQVGSHALSEPLRLAILQPDHP